MPPGRGAGQLGQPTPALRGRLAVAHEVLHLHRDGRQRPNLPDTLDIATAAGAAYGGKASAHGHSVATGDLAEGLTALMHREGFTKNSVEGSIVIDPRSLYLHGTEP